jgi:hypothetical protein
MVPVDGLPRGGQQRLDTGQNGIGTFKKSIQSGIHVFSSGTFTVMMAIQTRHKAFDERSTALQQGSREHPA